jgi:transcriptional regulator with XRE-family HTH domain
MAVSGRDDVPAAPPSFAERLDQLFLTVVNPQTGKQFSVRHVATACGLSHTHLNKLRSGLASDPRWSEMEVLARFFGVAIDHFVAGSPTDGAGRPIDDRLAVALQQPGVSQVAMRMLDQQLSAEGAAAVIAIIDQVARLEQAQRRRGDSHDPGPG